MIQTMTPCGFSAGFITTVRDSLSAEEEAGALLEAAEPLEVGAGATSAAVLGAATETEEVLDAACSLPEEADSLADRVSVGVDSAGLVGEDAEGSGTTEAAALLAGKDVSESDPADDSSASGSGVANSDETTTEEGAALDDVGSAVVVLESLPADTRRSTQMAAKIPALSFLLAIALLRQNQTEREIGQNRTATIHHRQP